MTSTGPAPACATAMSPSEVDTVWWVRSTSVVVTVRGPFAGGSEEGGEVLRQEQALVEQDHAARDEQAGAGAPQDVGSLAREDVLLALEPVAVDEERRADEQVVRAEARLLGRVHVVG